MLNRRLREATRWSMIVLALLSGCGGGGGDTPDGGTSDLTTPCLFAPLPATGGAGGTVTAGAVQAGAAEVILDLPVSSALGGFSARAVPYADYSNVDRRTSEFSGSFNPSVGIETRPMMKALAITAGTETVVILKADLIYSEPAVTAEVADRLGPEFAGKILFATSHSHSSFAQYSTQTAYAAGLGRIRQRNLARLIDRATDAAKAALAARRPAKIGIAVETNFDPKNEVTHDRRDEDDDLPGGKRKDDFLAVIRVDALDGAPIALVPIFGIHGIVLDADSPLASTDAPGGIERALEDTFDRRVLVMHLQGAGGSVSPSGRGEVGRVPGDVAVYDFARAEGVGIAAREAILPVWQRAGTEMKSELALEMLTRSVPLGPDWRTFKVREGEPGGPLTYSPWDPDRIPDREVFAGDGSVRTPIDEFNAPYGAGLCGDRGGFLFPMSQLPGVEDLVPYHTCMNLKVATPYFQSLFRLPPFEPMPICASTHAIVSALRIGEFLVAGLPGEPCVSVADRLRKLSPVAKDKTILIGYAQSHHGYLLTTEDWLRGGYESSINLWGPLEGDYLVERTVELMKLARTPEREDAAKGGPPVLRNVVHSDADVPPPDPAPLAGKIPDVLPGNPYVRGRIKLVRAQPEAMVRRLASARFLWTGEDPLAGTPRVRLQREEGGAFVDVKRRSGRTIEDRDLLLTWTPSPLFRTAPETRTHHWAVEWQAVSWTSDLAERAGVPLGKYRFHVEGTGYSVDSAPFEVIAAPLTVAAKIAGKKVEIDLAIDGKGGFRLLDLEAKSDGKVPLRKGPVTVDLALADGQTMRVENVVVDGAGHASVDEPGAAVKEVKVTDRFGNSGSAKP
ncbi:MAG: hypothetical protein EXR72_27045 [Myxococcales bacterium]|nr:hypothetical protein [Myxococcales bacterium]